MSKDEVLARRNGAMIDELPGPPPVMDGSEVATGDAASAPAPLETRLAPNIVLANAVAVLDAARHHSRECRSAVVGARSAFSAALTAWNATFPVQTQQQARQDYIDTNQATRAAKAALGQLRRPTTVGQMAKALAGGNAKQGGGASYRRGAFTKAQALEINIAKARATAIAAKLPSAR